VTAAPPEVFAQHVDGQIAPDALARRCRIVMREQLVQSRYAFIARHTYASGALRCDEGVGGV
jgi:hypothetical protein